MRLSFGEPIVGQLLYSMLWSSHGKWNYRYLANSYILGSVTILEEYQGPTPPFEKLGFGLQLMTPLFGCPA
jgi:hypothetical protein